MLEMLHQNMEKFAECVTMIPKMEKEDPTDTVMDFQIILKEILFSRKVRKPP